MKGTSGKLRNKQEIAMFIMHERKNVIDKTRNNKWNFWLIGTINNRVKSFYHSKSRNSIQNIRNSDRAIKQAKN